MTVCYISKEVEFDAAHRVPFHNSKCKNLHGHRYKIQAQVIGEVHEGTTESDEGMVIDFGVLKQYLMEFHDIVDHGSLVWRDDEAFQNALKAIPGTKYAIMDSIPTAENIAVWLFNWLTLRLKEHDDLHLYKVVIWETPTSVCEYYG
jgi:6-pyruvoyltetrahydropterin/6-carboxytetrahydropterin synthase